MKVKSTFFVIHDIYPENYKPITDIREMVAEDMANMAFPLDEELVLVDVVPYDDSDDNVEARHEVRMDAADLAREL